MLETTPLIGYVAAALTTGSLLPQVLRLTRTHRAKDISLLMYATLCLGLILWTIYGFIIGSSPIYIANGASFLLAAIILYLKIKNGDKK